MNIVLDFQHNFFYLFLQFSIYAIYRFNTRENGKIEYAISAKKKNEETNK